jgi:hypothetical protein
VLYGNRPGGCTLSQRVRAKRKAPNSAPFTLPERQQ